MTTQEKLRTDPAIAMVATSSPRLPAADKILAAVGAGSKPGFFGKLFGRKSTSDDDEWQSGSLVVPFHGGQLAVSLMPAPIPWHDLEGPCATAWWWPEATEKMRRHTHHFLLAIIGGTLQPIARRVALTKLANAVVKATDSVGVYWGEGTLVHEPSAFLPTGRRGQRLVDSRTFVARRARRTKCRRYVPLLHHRPGAARIPRD
ncbi:MAG: hypothetical protein QM775_35380 [Pirellulales bacterium]